MGAYVQSVLIDYVSSTESFMALKYSNLAFGVEGPNFSNLENLMANSESFRVLKICNLAVRIYGTKTLQSNLGAF
jgi:hypothetical protein